MENTQKGAPQALATVPKISGSSPLAVGFTVNIADLSENPGHAREWTPEALAAVDRGDKWHLRVWSQGQPIESSFHQTPSKAAMRLAAIVMDGTVGAKARGLAMEAFTELMKGGGL